MFRGRSVGTGGLDYQPGVYMPFNALFLVNFVLEAAFTLYIYSSFKSLKEPHAFVALIWMICQIYVFNNFTTTVLICMYV